MEEFTKVYPNVRQGALAATPNASSQEAEAGRTRVGGQPKLHINTWSQIIIIITISALCKFAALEKSVKNAIMFMQINSKVLVCIAPT